jgi:Tfp pilus assembly protein PilN
MKIKDRDIKILLLLLIVAIVVLPYVFFIKPTNEKIDSLTSEIQTLSERQAYLQALDQNREYYLNSIEVLNKSRDQLIANYPGGIKQENTIVFLRNLEVTNPLAMLVIAFGDVAEIPVSDAYVDQEGVEHEALTALAQTNTINFSGTYEDMKKMLAFFNNYEERMVVSAISMDKKETGLLEGTFVVNQYAVLGTGKELAPAKIPTVEHGVVDVFGNFIEGEEEPEAQTAESNEDETEEEED